MWKGLLLVAAAAGPSFSADFVRDIKPVFERSCIGCHGAKAQMGGLRLDSAKVAVKAIVAGKSAESTLYLRVAGLGDQARMPMGGKPLAAAEIAAIREWIDSGAEWPDAGAAPAAEVKRHWAFVAPKRPAAPAVSKAEWVRNPIDAIVLARLDREKLAPSPEADRTTLLRRLSLDLTGLPPVPAEVDAFIKDRSPRAYEKQVDRLLASPHYGEKWARQWLDAARYADSDGFEKDKQRQVWFWRDWVINAFNRDLPYDRFLIEQLAGDLLPNPTQDQIVATGFLRNSMVNEEGGIDPEQFRMEAMFDRMDAIGKAMLGITIQCAQCHNHKYDPVKQEDYYRLFAFLNNTHESNVAVYTAAEQKQREDLFRRIRAVETQVKRRAPGWQARMAKWEESLAKQPEWILVRPEVDDISTGGQKYLPYPDGSFLAAGYAPTKHRVKMTVKTDVKNITGFRLELLNDPNLPLGGPGRSIKGTGALTQFDVEVAGKTLAWAGATADINLPQRPLDEVFYDKTDRCRVTGPIAYAIDDKDDTAWGIDAGPGRRNVPRNAVFTPAAPVAEAGTLTFYLNQRHGGWNSDDNQNYNLGRIRLSITTSADPVADPVPAAVRAILAIPRVKRTAAQTAEIFSYWRTTIPEWQADNAAIEALWREHPEGSSQLILDERDTQRETRLLTRGDFLKPGKMVEAATPSWLNPLPAGAPANRLGLAKWMTSREAPTTARSFVNRVWQSYFGTGIVATSEDLGTQAEAPSHPELLDWLAVEFMERGWKVKDLHRAIVTSATYRQSSNVTPEMQQRDPYNRLLARAPRLRVDGEIVRDIALAASGLLNPEVGGPSIYAPAPEFLFQPPTSYGPKIWREATGPERYRRALYTFRYRSVPYPMLQSFDAPNGDFSCVRRTRSNTPLQALTTLNEPLFNEAAKALAARTLADGGQTDESRLLYAFRRCVSRLPDPSERDQLLSFLAKQKKRFDAPAAWTALARVLLNLDETITKE